MPTISQLRKGAGSKKPMAATPRTARAPKPNKMGAKRTVYDGNEYDSKAEAAYAQQLDLLKRGGIVTDWTRQLRFPLTINGTKVCDYILDFRVQYADGRVEHVDVKGQRTGQAYQMFRLKAKMMAACHQITVQEYPPKPKVARRKKAKP